MSGVSSTTALCKVGKQSGKGTGINTGLICGMLTQSGFNVDFDELEDLQEHGCRTVSVDRATVHKSQTDRAGYIVRGNLRGYLYPKMIGMMLLGAGFKPTTSTVTAGVYSHVFKLATRAEFNWLTVLSKIGDVTRRAVDCRIERELDCSADSQALRVSLRCFPFSRRISRAPARCRRHAPLPAAHRHRRHRSCCASRKPEHRRRAEA